MNAEFFAALEQLEKEKGISVDYMLERVGQALIAAYKKMNDGMTDNVYVDFDRKGKSYRLYVRKTVVDDVYEPYEELSVEEAREYKPNAMLGDVIDIDMDHYTIEARVTEEEFARRRNSKVMPESWVRGGWLARYQKLVSSADEGAILRDTL